MLPFWGIIIIQWIYSQKLLTQHFENAEHLNTGNVTRHYRKDIVLENNQSSTGWGLANPLMEAEIT